MPVLEDQEATEAGAERGSGARSDPRPADPISLPPGGEERGPQARSSSGTDSSPAATGALAGRQGRPGIECEAQQAHPAHTLLRILLFGGALYGFLFSIDLMGAAFKLLGGGFAAALLETLSNPLAAIFGGLLVTSILQSSSFTTSMVVGLVAAGTLPLPIAIPIVMGANIGTTITNTLVSLTHVRQKVEFERAFSAATVHDFFNVLTALLLFPIEMYFHPLEWLATRAGALFTNAGGFTFMSPLQTVLDPLIHLVRTIVPSPVILLAISLVLLFVCLAQMVRIMRSLIMQRVERLFDRVLFRNDGAAFLFGWGLTSVVQSSSVTTSLVIPLVATGMLTVRRIYTYTLGANLGTTITALLAAFAIQHPAGIMVAFAHMFFNMGGILVWYPARAVPIALATRTGRFVAGSRRGMLVVFVGCLVVYFGPVLYLLLH